MKYQINPYAAAFIGTAVLVNGSIWARESVELFTDGIPPDVPGVELAVSSSATSAENLSVIAISAEVKEWPKENYPFYISGPKNPGPKA